MTIRPIKSRLEAAALHPDVLAENFSEDIFTLDIGPVVDGSVFSPGQPADARTHDRRACLRNRTCGG
jgi:hypothetical protein